MRLSNKVMVCVCGMFMACSDDTQHVHDHLDMAPVSPLDQGEARDRGAESGDLVGAEGEDMVGITDLMDMSTLSEDMLDLEDLREGADMDMAADSGDMPMVQDMFEGHDMETDMVGVDLGAPGDMQDMDVDLPLADMAPPSPPLVFSMNTASNTVTLHTNRMVAYNYEVDWDNDGVFDDLQVRGDATHDYGAPGVYTIRVRGQFPQMYVVARGATQQEPSCAVDIKSWGGVQLQGVNSMFAHCASVTVSAMDQPDFSQVTSFNQLFYNVGSIQGNLANWDTSSVTHMINTFNNVGALNADISGWDTSSVTSMRRAFYSADFSTPHIGGWDVSSVTDMSEMFMNAELFNDALGSWNTGQVEDMSFMFLNARAFDQDLGSWNTSQVTDMSVMFSGAISFNGDVSGWDTSSVTNMFGMFRSCHAFDQDVSSWDVSSVLDMRQMFYNARVFSQDLGGWDVSDIRDMDDMLSGSGLSRADYDATLDGWSLQAMTSRARTLDAQGLTYCMAQTARQTLIDNGWTIQGDVYDCN